MSGFLKCSKNTFKSWMGRGCWNLTPSLQVHCKIKIRLCQSCLWFSKSIIPKNAWSYSKPGSQNRLRSIQNLPCRKSFSRGKWAPLGAQEEKTITPICCHSKRTQIAIQTSKNVIQVQENPAGRYQLGKKHRAVYLKMIYLEVYVTLCQADK